LSTKKSKSEPSADMKLIIKLHNQWCRDNGYPIKERIIHFGKAAAQYGQKKDQNVSKTRQ